MPRFTIDCPLPQPELPDFNTIKWMETDVRSTMSPLTHYMYHGKWNNTTITRKLTASKSFTSKHDVYQWWRNGHLEQFKIINSTREHSWIDEQVGQVTLVQRNYGHVEHWLKSRPRYSPVNITTTELKWVEDGCQHTISVWQGERDGNQQRTYWLHTCQQKDVSDEINRREEIYIWNDDELVSYHISSRHSFEAFNYSDGELISYMREVTSNSSHSEQWLEVELVNERWSINIGGDQFFTIPGKKMEHGRLHVTDGHATRWWTERHKVFPQSVQEAFALTC